MFKSAISKILQQPYRLFLLAAVLTFVSSLFVGNKQVDIHFSDTMFVVPGKFFLWPLALCFVLVSLLYQWLHKFLPKKAFIWMHVVLTLGTLLGAVTLFYWHHEIFPPIDVATRGRTISYVMDRYRNQMFTYTVIIFLLTTAQIVFVIHLVYGLISYSRKKPSTLS